MYIELEAKGKVFVIFLICLGVVAFMVTRSTNVTPPVGVYKGGTVPGTIAGFFRVPPQDAEHLLNINPSTVVIDCNPGGSDYFAGRKLPNAVWGVDSSIYKGQNMVLLLYSTPDDGAIDFARSLVGNMRGEVYVLTGGYQAWNSWVNRSV